jgi:pyrophosphate--fructose-6-phosphate 1-phosphotransferase
MIKSPLQTARASYVPKMPKALKGKVSLTEGNATQSVADQEEIKKMFPKTYGMPVITFENSNSEPEYPAINVGVILSGGQAPGGHNVIAGLFDGLKRVHKDSKLYGFLGGPGGLINNEYMEITSDMIDEYRNTGGFDIIGSGRTKLEEKDQFDKGVINCKALDIKALVIIGGDDSNTNACVLAEYYLQNETGIQVIGVPKTIDGDLKNEMIETSFGFDTACKVYSELIGNIQRDANSAKKYWHFIKLMGRSASHIALECALQTQPNVTIISERVEQEQQTLDQIVNNIAEVIAKRAENNENFGTVLIPEGLVEFIPEIKALIAELNDLLAENLEYFNNLPTDNEKMQYVNHHLDDRSSKVFSSLPGFVQLQLLADRDPHGNVQVSKIETEKLLIDMVGDLLGEWKAKEKYKGTFASQAHFFGYEGRCAAPSNYDADYTYSLGYTASLLIATGKSGYMASIRNSVDSADNWISGGIPITMMMNMEKRHGKMKPVIQKALVDLHGKPYREFEKSRDSWAVNTSFVYPGPIQYFGPTEVCDSPPKTLVMEQQD